MDIKPHISHHSGHGRTSSLSWGQPEPISGQTNPREECPAYLRRSTQRATYDIGSSSYITLAFAPVRSAMTTSSSLKPSEDLLVDLSGLRQVVSLIDWQVPSTDTGAEQPPQELQLASSSRAGLMAGRAVTSGASSKQFRRDDALAPVGRHEDDGVTLVERACGLVAGVGRLGIDESGVFGIRRLARRSLGR